MQCMGSVHGVDGLWHEDGEWIVDALGTVVGGTAKIEDFNRSQSCEMIYFL